MFRHFTYKLPLKLTLVVLQMVLICGVGKGQTQLTLDAFGTTAQNPISRTGWTANAAGGSAWELRTTGASSGYSWTNPAVSSSGGANVFTNLGTNTNTKQLTFDNSLSTISYTSISVRFGGLKSGTVPNISVLYSTDGSTYTSAGTVTLTTSWAAYSVSLPAAAEGVSNLRIRFEVVANNNSSNFLRLDDFSIIGTLVCTPPADPTGSITPAANPACTSTTLTYSAPSANIYWQTSSTGTSTSNPTTSAYTVTTSGTYYVRAYNGSCWSTNSLASAAITINATPTISGTTSVSVGGTTTLTGSPAGGTWSSSNNSIATVSAGGVVTGVAVGSCNITYTLSGCSNFVAVNVGLGPCLSEDFTAEALPAGWIETSISWTEAPGQASFNANTGTLAAISVGNPTGLTFNLSRTTNTTAKTLYVEVSTTSQSSGFTTVATYDHSNTTSGGTTSCNVDLSAYSGYPTVYIRFRKASSTTSPWRLDDVVVNCGGSCAAPTTQASNITISNVYSTQLTVSWTNGDGAKRIVIMNTINSFTNPTDGVDPTANAVYSGSGQQVIFNGTGTTVTVSGLSASTTYYFRVYEANCFGTSIKYYTVTATGNPGSGTTNTTAPPVGATTFNPGDIIIVGFDTNIGSGGYDMITVASFVPIGPGTKIILANMVYEFEDAAYVSTGRWYRCSSNASKGDAGHPQYLEITYNGSAVLAAGTVLCITLNNVDDCFQSILVNGAASSDFSDNGSGQVNMSSTDPDAVFLMQGTFSAIQTAGSAYSYRTFSGNVLGGIQSRGSFQPFSVAGNAGGERVSRIHPDIECVRLNTGGGATEFYQYYFDFEMHIGSQHALLNNIFDMAGTWDMGTGSATTNEVPTCGVTFTITSSSVQGKWTGESNEDWFNCANWDCFTVPDSLTDVTVNSDSPSNNCIIDITTYSANAVKYGNIAKCRHITLNGVGTNNYRLIIQGAANNKLKAFGNFTITGNGMLDMTDGNGTTADGTIDLLGNWINSVGPTRFDEGNSVINFLGSSQQQISCNSLEEVFYTLAVNNTGGILLNDNIQISGNLTLTNGIITTGTKMAYVSNDNFGAINTYGTNGFVNGNLRRNFALNTDIYPFPVGDGTAATNYKRLDFINNSLNLSTGTDYLDLYVKTITESGLNDDPYLVAVEDLTQITELLEDAAWIMEPSGTISSGSWGCRLYVKNISNLSAADDNRFTALKRPTGSALYGQWDTYYATTAIPAASNSGRIYDSGNGYAQKTGFTSFCELAIGKGATPLPITLSRFNASFNGESVDLLWETSSEINNDYFTIEKSTDGVDFNSIANIKGAGNSVTRQYYSYEDEYPIPGTIYYRLKQTDFDGKESYSDIVPVSVVFINKTTFYYSPLNTSLFISSGNNNCKALLKISDLHGIPLFTENVIIEGGLAIVKLNKSIIGSGLRIVTVITNDSAESKRIFFE